MHMLPRNRSRIASPGLNFDDVEGHRPSRCMICVQTSVRLTFCQVLGHSRGCTGRGLPLLLAVVCDDLNQQSAGTLAMFAACELLGTCHCTLIHMTSLAVRVFYLCTRQGATSVRLGAHGLRLDPRAAQRAPTTGTRRLAWGRRVLGAPAGPGAAAASTGQGPGPGPGIALGPIANAGSCA